MSKNLMLNAQFCLSSAPQCCYMYVQDFDIMNMDLLDLENESQIEELTVKQLKIVLKKNCIDFKGCVEKQELTERVRRLWTAKKKAKGRERGEGGRERLNSCPLYVCIV